MSRRFYRGWNPREHFAVRFHPARLDQPLRWRKPRRVFVCSMGDLFHEDVETNRLRDIWFTMMLAKQHTFMVLTKRPENIIPQLHRTAWKLNSDSPYLCKPMWPDHIWIGVTAENQEMADKRIPILLQTPAAVRFVSVEPMLGRIDLQPFLEWTDLDGGRVNRGPHWVICGEESGPKRRLSPINAIQELREQCVSAGIPFFLKQMEVNGKVVKMPKLDGRVWDEFPTSK
jgi:protein gp37